MSKKVYLTSDGYSYHTLELRYNPTDKALETALKDYSSTARHRRCIRRKTPMGVFMRGAVMFFRKKGFRCS